MIQEHIHPRPKVTSPHSPTELERAQQLAKLLEEKARLEMKIQGEEEKVSKGRLAVSKAEDDLSILQQEMRGLSFQIDAHHREDDVGGTRIKVGVMIWRVSLWRRLIVVRRLGFRLMGGKRRRVGRFGGGLSPPRVTPDYLMELMRGMSEEDQATFKRNMGSHGVDDVSSLEGDKPQVGVHGLDMTETPCL